MRKLIERLEGVIAERQKDTPALAFPDEAPDTRVGAFKISKKAMDLFKDGLGSDWTLDKSLFTRHRATIDDIPRNDLPAIWGEDNMADAQDVIAMHPKKAFQLFLKNAHKASPKLGKLLRAQPNNAALLFYVVMVRVSGRDIADVVIKKYFMSK